MAFSAWLLPSEECVCGQEDEAASRCEIHHSSAACLLPERTVCFRLSRAEFEPTPAPALWRLCLVWLWRPEGPNHEEVWWWRGTRRDWAVGQTALSCWGVLGDTKSTSRCLNKKRWVHLLPVCVDLTSDLCSVAACGAGSSFTHTSHPALPPFNRKQKQPKNVFVWDVQIKLDMNVPDGRSNLLIQADMRRLRRMTGKKVSRVSLQVFGSLSSLWLCGWKICGTCPVVFILQMRPKSQIDRPTADLSPTSSFKTPDWLSTLSVSPPSAVPPVLNLFSLSNLRKSSTGIRSLFSFYTTFWTLRGDLKKEKRKGWKCSWLSGV